MALRASESLGYGVGIAARAFEHALRDGFAEYGVLPGQFAVLLALYENDGLTQAELARLLSISQPTMAATLKRMDRDGLVAPEPDPDDARRRRIYLTAHAIELETPLTDAARAVNRRAVRGLSASERAHMYGLIEHVRENLLGA